MNKISDNTNLTLVKIFINTLASASLVFSPIAFAQSTTTPPATGTTPQQPIIVQTGATTSPDDIKLKQQEMCNQANKTIDDAYNKIAEACRKAGMGGGSNCVEKSKNCGEVSGESSFNTMGAIASALGVQGTSQAAVSGACPQLSGRDYFTEKDKITQEIKDTEKDLKDLEKEKADAKKEYDKSMQEINEDIAKAQEEYKKKELEIDQTTRERVAEFNKVQSETAEELRKTGAEILALEGKLIQSQRNKAQRMITLSENVAKRTCMKEVQKARAEYLAVSSGSSGNHISSAKQKKEALIKTYTECMDQFNQQRISLNEEKQTEYTSLNSQIANMKSRQSEIQGSLNLADSQLKEMQAAATKEKANALQSVVDLGTRAQEKMKAAYENLVANQAAIDKQITSLTAALNRANNAITGLGPVPTSRSGDYSPGDAAGEIESQLNLIAKADRNAPESCKSSVTSSIKDTQKKLGVK